MRRFQFSLRALLGLVLFVAVGCAALVHANELVASAVYSVTLLVLFVAIVRGLFGADSGRVFWLGFAIFGWGYVWVAYGEIQILGLGLPATCALATTKLLDFVEARARESGARELALDTAVGAKHLIDMYLRKGYRLVDKVDWPETNYLSVVMSKNLEHPARDGGSGSGAPRYRSDRKPPATVP